ncbi:MAG: CoA transferase [Chloroflexi bacterium]|nr:CoA transferase [Chloroflexota bacterium]
MASERRLPLQGIRVTDLTAVLAGTNAATLLGDWGAEVIRIEPLQIVQPVTRAMLAHPAKEWIDANHNWITAYVDWDPGEQPWNRWCFYNSHGRNKLSMTADLSKPEGQEMARNLIRISDLVIENNVPDTFEKWNLGYDQVRAIKPDLVMLRMPGYGLSGRYRTYRSFGSHIEGASGHTSMRGYPDTDPTMIEDVYYGDAAAAATAAYAAIIALRQMRMTGKGQLIELTQTDTVMTMFGEHFLDYQMNGRVPRPMANDYYNFAPHNTYPCRGHDRWIAIAVGRDEQWRAMVQVMMNPEWADDARFTDQDGRFQHRAEIDGHVSEWTRQYDNRWLMERLQRAGVPAGVLNDDADAYSDPHLASREFFQELNLPDAGVHRYPGIIWELLKTPNRIRQRPY